MSSSCSYYFLLVNTSCHVSTNFFKCVVHVLRLCHCALLFVRGREEWVDEKTDGEKREVLNPNVTYDPVYVSLHIPLALQLLLRNGT